MVTNAKSDAAVLLNSFPPPHPVDSGRFGESVNCVRALAAIEPAAAAQKC